MEVIGLVPGAAQALAQLTGVVKIHVVSYSSLKSLAASVEAKAEREWSVAHRLNEFAETPELSTDLMNHTLRLIQENLSDVDKRIQSWKSAGILGSMNAIQRSEEQESKQELRELILEACSALLPASVGEDEARRSLLRLQSKASLGEIPRSPISSSESNADLIFNLGLAEYGRSPGFEKPFGHKAEPMKVRSAARYFHRACSLGKPW